MDRTMNLFRQESATRRAWENWKAERKSNERRWMLAKDLEWIIWAVVASLILSAFAIEATYRAETCISALRVDAFNGVEDYAPTDCT